MIITKQYETNSQWEFTKQDANNPCERITKEHEEKACKIFTKQKRRTLIESAQNNIRSSHLHLHSTVLREYSFTEILNYSEIRICEMKI